ncbi:hypothetical protein BCON_0101g00120 [Botryotinia convoluta]|uniref:Uncharacterized protein n=1 Tax=Botryotinia convoluta TaxID=54673 RepID=A0A4Z1I7P1_9HELO|nr:hypothetical protein BCON_0101g00120 [Botryotinia convoluta]
MKKKKKKKKKKKTNPNPTAPLSNFIFSIRSAHDRRGQDPNTTKIGNPNLSTVQLSGRQTTDSFFLKPNLVLT